MRADRDRLICGLQSLNRRGVPWLLSYDGQCGAKRYGEYLPAHLLWARGPDADGEADVQPTMQPAPNTH